MIHLFRKIKQLLFYKQNNPRKPKIYVETSCGHRWLMVNGIAVRDITTDELFNDNYSILRLESVNNTYWRLRDMYNL